MDWLAVWGWVCAGTGAFIGTPQLIRVLRERTSAGMSLLMWQLNTAAGLGWTLHGLRTGAPNVIAANALVSIFAILITRMVADDRGIHPLKVWTLVAAVVAFLGAVEFLATPELFGLTVMVPLAVGMVGQGRDLLTAPDLTGVSPLYLVLTFVIQLMWGSWAWLAGDNAIVVCATILGVIGLVNLGLYARRALRA